MNDLDNRLMTSAQVRATFGGISDMAIWRWLHDPKVAFPAPIYINKRRFWNASEIDAFRRKKEQETALRRAMQGMAKEKEASAEQTNSSTVSAPSNAA
jgi:predicted DNA-binding transcriptional regulator AlpA